MEASKQFESLKADLVPKMMQLDMRVSKPCERVQSLLANTRKLITKRNHKKLDFDRHHASLEKYKVKEMKAAGAGTGLSEKEQVQLNAAEQAFILAEEDFIHHDEQMHLRLPIDLGQLGNILAPILNIFVLLQLHFYQSYCGRLEEMAERRKFHTEQTLPEIVDSFWDTYDPVRVNTESGLPTIREGKATSQPLWPRNMTATTRTATTIPDSPEYDSATDGKNVPFYSKFRSSPSDHKSE